MFINTNNNFTETKLAGNSGIYFDDSINRYFCRENFTGKSLFELTIQKILLNNKASISFDDITCEKKILN